MRHSLTISIVAHRTLTVAVPSALCSGALYAQGGRRAHKKSGPGIPRVHGVCARVCCENERLDG